MKTIYDVIKRPLITEKCMDLTAEGKYAFEVALDSNKIEIKDAVEKIYNVKVDKVNTLVVKGKKRSGTDRRGKGKRVTGMTSEWKKAYVTLKPGEKIDIYEGA